MKYIRYSTPEKELHLYPLVCWHIGCQQSDSGFIAGIIERIAADPLARWVYMGDGGECVTKMSKGDIYKQFLSPAEQQNELIKLLTPIKDKGLFGIRGNHGHRIYKETGLDWDETLLGRIGIPYLGVDAFWQLILRGGDPKNQIPFDIYTHHGVDSGITIASKVNKAKAMDASIMADTILTAHSHVAMDLPPRYMAFLAQRVEDPIHWIATHEYICGSAYDSRTGYAAERGYPPILPSHLKITFKVGGHGGRVKTQFSEIIRKEDI